MSIIILCDISTIFTLHVNSTFPKSLCQFLYVTANDAYICTYVVVPSCAERCDADIVQGFIGITVTIWTLRQN